MGKILDQTKSQLKQVMLVSHETPYLVNGKTGKAQGVVVDCWFTGFVENENENLYYCAYLGETKGENPFKQKKSHWTIKGI